MLCLFFHVFSCILKKKRQITEIIIYIITETANLQDKRVILQENLWNLRYISGTLAAGKCLD